MRGGGNFLVQIISTWLPSRWGRGGGVGDGTLCVHFGDSMKIFFFPGYRHAFWHHCSPCCILCTHTKYIGPHVGEFCIIKYPCVCAVTMSLPLSSSLFLNSWVVFPFPARPVECELRILLTPLGHVQVYVQNHCFWSNQSFMYFVCCPCTPWNVGVPLPVIVFSNVADSVSAVPDPAKDFLELKNYKITVKINLKI